MAVKKKPTKIQMMQQVIDDQRTILAKAHDENARLRASLQNRLDVSMLAERQKLAYAIGQMTEAVSKAILVIIGKETL